MKKWISFVFVLALLEFSLISVHAYAETQEEKSVHVDRQELIAILKKSIRLNEEYKEAVKGAPLAEAQRKREELQKYDEQVLFPSLHDLVSLLSVGVDVELTIEYMKLIVSYKNAADESLSYSLGEIFMNNPRVIEKAIGRFSKDDKVYVYQQLEWGLDNVIYNNKGDSRISDRKAKLRQLKSEIEK